MLRGGYAMKKHRMITALVLVLVLLLAHTGGFAAAAPARMIPSKAVETGPDPDKALWLEMKAAAKPYQAEMRALDNSMKALSSELSTETEAARIRIKNMLSASITQQQLTHVNDQLAQLKRVVKAADADVGRLSQEMTALLGRKSDLDMNGMIACFEDAIAIQKDRLTLLSEAVELVKAIASEA